jgi:cytochrome P450
VYFFLSGQPLDLSGLTNISILNALWSIVTGDQLELENPILWKVIEHVNAYLNSLSVNGSSSLNILLPSAAIAKLPFFRSISGFQSSVDAVKSFLDLIGPYIDNHKRTLDPNNVRDLLDVILLELENNKNPESCFGKRLGESSVVNLLFELFVGGIESTTTTLITSILHLVHHQDVQLRMHQEIDEV